MTMGALAKEFAKAFTDGLKEGPRIFFAPLRGAVQGAAKAIKEEINRPYPSNSKPHTERQHKKVG